MRLRALAGLLILWIVVPLCARNLQTSYRYSYLPKSVYLHQVFPVTVLGTDAKDSHPSFRFDPSSAIRPLASRPLTIINGNDGFYTFYFKAERSDFSLPTLWIQDDRASYRLEGRKIPVRPLHAEPEQRFCGVIASDFTVKNSQVSTFDDTNNLIYLNLVAHEANLEDMHIPGVVEDGIEKFHRNGALASAEYYFVIPANVPEITFSYFDTIKQRFVPVTVSTNYRYKPVAAQVDLNPKDSSFTKLKKYGVGALAIFLLLMFLIYRDWFYLFFFILAVALLVTFFLPLKKICVTQGAPLYILPIPDSTVGTRIPQRIEAPILHRYGHFYKIEYHNATGWIKDEDVCKD
ncbi:hypothetical protein [Nitratifractor sp.]